MNISAPALAVAAFCAAAHIVPARAQGVSVGDFYAADQKEYDYNSVCVFAELVSGYVLPQVDTHLLRDPRLHRKPTVPGLEALGRTYAFTGDGVAGTLWWDKRGTSHGPDQSPPSYFTEFQVAPHRLPPALRSRGALMNLINARWQPGTSSGFVVGCEIWSAKFSFAGEALNSINFQNRISSRD